ncbi:hypothetical protein [Azospirillum sp. sgz301742]
MPRPFIFPDPRERSPNSPSIIASPQQILGLYNQINQGNAKYVTDNVKNWFVGMAMQLGWSAHHCSGNQIVLFVDFRNFSYENNASRYEIGYPQPIPKIENNR